ncbi:uncharacterized protein [Linepithema humile]|uniref:uncharacterized protein n=1 Tax=Linepithema humile TaxID=83485 RepID=UPI00351EA644
MDFFDNEYYGLTRHLMASIGLWPYEKSERRVIRVFCVSFLLVQAVLLQLATFITHEYSTTLFIDVFSFNILCIIYALKYNIVYFNLNHVKQLFDKIRRDWNSIKNIDELNIIRKYAYKARFYTIFSGLIVYPGTFAFILTMFIPDVLDIIAPLDEPRPRKLPAQIECFVDEEKYFYLISFVFTICAFLGMTVLMATETMYMIFIQHACGLFELISYRLTDAFNTSSSRTSVPFKSNFYIKLLSALSIHQHCLEFLEDIQHKFATSYFVLCGFGVASLSINMFRLFLAMSMHDMSEIILTGLFVYAHFCYIFWMNYFGQDIIDHSEWFFQQICNTQWYIAPLHIQKLLLITLQRSMKNSSLVIGSLFVPSLEGFATLSSMSMSYCMVLYSFVLSYVAKMDFDGSRYYTINRLMLSSIGLWPYQNSWSIRIQRFSCLVCFITCIIFQLLTFVTYEYNLNLLLEVLSSTIPCFIAILKYVAYCVKTESMRKLMDMIKYDWNSLKNNMEYQIIQKYTYIGTLYAQLFALITCTFPLFFGFAHLVPNLLDLVMPLNQSRPHQILILVEYFFDIDKYFYVAVLHLVVVVFVLQITLMSTTSIYVTYVQHACGMFEIASYRIEHALDDCEKDDVISGRCCTACTRIISAVNVHRRAIEFFEFMKDTFVIMYFFLLLFGMASLTISLYRAVTTEGIVENIIPIINMSVHLFYFFFVNYSGQKILDHSNNFAWRIYNSKWHMTSLHTQKLILFIMQRSMKSCMLLVGGIYVASLEGFATVIIFVSLTCGITFNMCVIFFADGLFVLGYEHVHILLYGNLFNNDVNENFLQSVLRKGMKFLIFVTYSTE